MFAGLERFVVAHRPCGELMAEVGQVESSEGYLVRVTCLCAAAFERWVR